jgi:hypothetical protein
MVARSDLLELPCDATLRVPRFGARDSELTCVQSGQRMLRPGFHILQRRAMRTSSVSQLFIGLGRALCERLRNDNDTFIC